MQLRFLQAEQWVLTLYTAFKDALIAQNCAVEWRTVTEQVRDVQEVQGAPLDVLAMLEQEGYEIEAVEPLMGAAARCSMRKWPARRTKARAGRGVPA